MTRAAYLGWMEHKIMIEGQLVDHSKWPCRKKRLNNVVGKNRDNRFNERTGDRDYRQMDEEFFVIEEMMNNDETMRLKKLFILYIQMDDPVGRNKDVASIAWTPLAKVFENNYLMCIVNYYHFNSFLHFVFLFNYI